jgi:hypothetical protein
VLARNGMERMAIAQPAGRVEDIKRRRRFMKRRDFLFVAAMLAPAIRHASAQQPAPKKRLAVIALLKVED